MKLSKLVAILSCGMRYPSPQEGPHPKHVLDYHSRIESEFRKLPLKDVETPPHVSVDAFYDDNDQIVAWREDFTYLIYDLAAVEVAERSIVQIVRRVGIKFNHRFSLKKQIVIASDERDVYDRRLYPNRDTKWVLYVAPVRLRNRRKPTPGYPSRLQYLAQMARRCVGRGGNDVYGLFEKQADLNRFFAALADKDRAELVNLYCQIVRGKDN